MARSDLFPQIIATFTASINDASDIYNLKEFEFSPKRRHPILKDNPDVPVPVVMATTDKVKDVVQATIDRAFKTQVKSPDGKLVLKKDDSQAILIDPGVGIIGATTTSALKMFSAKDGKLRCPSQIPAEVSTADGTAKDANVNATIDKNAGTLTLVVSNVKGRRSGVHNVLSAQDHLGQLSPALQKFVNISQA